MEEILKKAIEDLDADYAEMRLERAEATGISYMGKELEDIGTVFGLGGCVRVCVRGGWGFSSFNRIEDARESALKACRLAELAGGSGTVLAPVEKVKADFEDKVDINPPDIPLEDKKSLMWKYNEIMLGRKEIVTTNVIYRDSVKDIWLLTSEGSSIHQKRIRAGVSFSAVARDGVNIQKGRKSFGDTRGYGTVINHEADVEEVIKITGDLIKAPKVKSGIYTVVLDPQLAGVFAHEAFGHLSESDFVYENPEAREMMKLGRRFGPDFLNIIDNGDIPGESGYTPYDDEGVKGGRTYLIKDGLLVGRLHSRETAGKMGETPTGNARAINTEFRPIVRMTNTFIDGGDTAFEEMIGGIENGIYACGFLGGNTDLERFTFSSAYAYKIEKGKLTTPLRDVILSGNVFETMHNIDKIGNDRTLFGGLGGCGKSAQYPLPVSDGSPHICIKNILVG